MDERKLIAFKKDIDGFNSKDIYQIKSSLEECGKYLDGFYYTHPIVQGAVGVIKELLGIIKYSSSSLVNDKAKKNKDWIEFKYQLYHLSKRVDDVINSISNDQ